MNFSHSNCEEFWAEIFVLFENKTKKFFKYFCNSFYENIIQMNRYFKYNYLNPINLRISRRKIKFRKRQTNGNGNGNGNNPPDGGNQGNN